MQQKQFHLFKCFVQALLWGGSILETGSHDNSHYPTQSVQGLHDPIVVATKQRNTKDEPVLGCVCD